MADRKFSMSDYIDVAERIEHFIAKYPEGSLQTIGWHVHDVAGQPFIVYQAAAYRAPDDPRPGHGTAWEPFPGKTSFTKDSELMNAETAAWGRAIVALGLTAKRKIASRQEVQARQGGDTPAKDAPATDKQISYLASLAKKHKPSEEVKRAMFAQVGGTEGTDLTAAQVSALIEMFKSGTLPTGSSDIPSDPPPVEDAPNGDPVPWDDSVLPSKDEAQQLLDEAKGGS